MNSYVITITEGQPVWDEIPIFSVDNILWLPDVGIRMSQQICYDEERLYINGKSVIFAKEMRRLEVGRMEVSTGLGESMDRRSEGVRSLQVPPSRNKPLCFLEKGSTGVFFVCRWPFASICNYFYPFPSPWSASRRPPTEYACFLQNYSVETNCFLAVRHETLIGCLNASQMVFTVMWLACVKWPRPLVICTIMQAVVCGSWMRRGIETQGS